MISVVLAASALVACDEEQPRLAAVPVSKPVPDGPTWEATRAIANDPSKAIVEQIAALEKYHASPGAARGSTPQTAITWAAVLEAKRKLNGAYLVTVDELDNLNARAATRSALRDGSLFEVGEAAVYFGSIRASHHGRSEDHAIGPIPFRGLAGEDVSVSYELDYGPSSFRRDLTRAAGLLPDAPDAARENLWSPEAQMEAINVLLRRHAGGGLFAAAGRLNRASTRRLLRAFEKNLEDEFLGVPLDQAYPVFAYRLRKYAAVYRALKQVGLAQAKQAYRAAVKKDSSAMLGFYESWAKAHDIQELAGLEYDWDARNPTGFWMRRMADGTDRMLFATLQRVLKRIAPDDASR